MQSLASSTERSQYRSPGGNLRIVFPDHLQLLEALLVSDLPQRTRRLFAGAGCIIQILQYGHQNRHSRLGFEFTQ